MKLRKKPAYPLRLLPYPHYKLIKFDDFFNEFYLIRYINKGRTPRTKKEICDRASEIYDVSTFKNGMSMSLVSVYKKTDVLFDPNHDKQLGYDAPWNFDGAKKPDELNYNYRYRGYVGIKVVDVLNFKIPLEQENRKGILVKKQFCLELGHYPTKCNFWHCMFYLREWVDDGKPLNLSVNYSNKKASLLMEHAVTPIAELSVLPRYVKERYLLRSKYKQPLNDVVRASQVLNYVNNKGGTITKSNLIEYLSSIGLTDIQSIEYFTQRILAANFTLLD